MKLELKQLLHMVAGIAVFIVSHAPAIRALLPAQTAGAFATLCIVASALATETNTPKV